MIAPEHALPIKRQAELAGISRGAVYYLPREACEADCRLIYGADYTPWLLAPLAEAARGSMITAVGEQAGGEAVLGRAVA